MDKSKLNFVIDALMFLCLMGLAGLGFLMKYVLLPGRVAWAKYGRNVELTWLGWDRHDWGQIHLYLAFILLGVLVIHLILHWKMILGLFARLVPDPQTRTRLAWAVLALTVFLLFFPFLITPDVRERGRGGGRGRGHSRLNAVPAPGSSLATQDYAYLSPTARDAVSGADNLLLPVKSGAPTPKEKD
jgi:hypothetical protein